MHFSSAPPSKGVGNNPYPSNVTDDEWNFIVPYLTLMKDEHRNGDTSCASFTTHCAG